MLAKLHGGLLLVDLSGSLRSARYVGAICLDGIRWRLCFFGFVSRLKIHKLDLRYVRD